VTFGGSRPYGGGYRTSTVTTSSPLRENQVTYSYPTRTSTVHTSSPMRMDVVRESATHGSNIVEVREGTARVVGERYTEGKIINEYTRALEERVIQPQFIPQGRTYRTSHVVEEEEEPVFVEKIVEKPVEIIVEKRVPKERYVDVPYDVIVEKPIERIIEKEIEIEKLVHREIEKTVEVPVERIVEVPYEEVIEKSVEVKKYVHVPYETIREHRIEEVHENLIYHDQVKEVDSNNLHQYKDFKKLPAEVRYQERRVEKDVPVYKDNFITKFVDKPYDKIIEVPKERIVHKEVENKIEVPVYIDNIIEKEVKVPVEQVVERPVEHIVEVPFFRDNIIKKPVPVIVDRTVIENVPVPRRIEVPFYTDNIIERVIDVPVHVDIPVDREVDVDIPQFRDKPVPVKSVNIARNLKVYRDRPQIMEVEETENVDFEVWRQRPVPQESVIEVEAPEFTTNVTEKTIDTEITCTVIIEQPLEVQREVEVIVEKKVERPKYVEEIVEKEVLIDHIIEQEFEVIVPKQVKREVIKEVTLPRKTISQSPVENTINSIHDVNITTQVEVPIEAGEIEEADEEVESSDLHNHIMENKDIHQQIIQENRRLEVRIRELKSQTGPESLIPLNHAVRQNAELESQISELKSRLDIVDKDRARLEELSQTLPSHHVIEVNIPHPEIQLRSEELQRKVEENRRLIGHAKKFNI